MRFALPVLVALTWTTAVPAANHYIRDGATGAPPCSDWSLEQACDALPDTLIRGDTYYLADGTYPGRTLDTPAANGSIITIKKATATDHGSEVGWQSTLGDGQATFAGPFDFMTHDWVVDGQTRNDSDWFDAAAYGFAIGSSADEYQLSGHNYGNIPSNIQVRYVYLPGWAAPLPDVTRRIYAVDWDDYDGGSEATGLVFSHMYVSGSNNVWFIRTTRGTIIEYSASDGVKSNSANHGEIVNCYYSVFDTTIRYNIFRNAFLGNGGTALIAIAVPHPGNVQPRIDIYGNLFANYQTGDAAIGFLGNSDNGGYCKNCNIYNNTFVNGAGGTGIQFPDGSGNVIQNNLFVNSGDVPSTSAPGSIISHNAFGPGAGSFGSDAQANVPTSIFMNYAAGDFRLAMATAPGVVQPDNRDLTHQTRGADGVWDRGAYEFDSGADHTPPAPPNMLLVQ